MILEISSPLEIRAEGRLLTGPAIRYGDVSDSHRERFEPGAFALDGSTRWLNYRHEPDRVLAFTGGGGLELEDSLEALTVSATLPRIPLADHALAEYRAGHLRGFSLEFRAIEETMGDGLRIIQRAELAGIGLVQSPSYSQSKAELRARSGRTIRASFPANKNLDCACSGGGCTVAKFTDEGVEGMLTDAFSENGGEKVAAWVDYARPLASKSKGTLRRVPGNAVDVDVPVGASGDAVMAAAEDAGIVIRPFLDAAQSEFVREGEVAIYSKMRVRAFIISSTDERGGWPEPIIVATPGEPFVDRSTTPSLESLWL